MLGAKTAELKTTFLLNTVTSIVADDGLDLLL